MSSRWWYTSAFRWLEFPFSISSSIFRWPGLNLSYFTTGWSIGSFSFSRWLEFTIFDDVFWTIVMVLESVALVAMLCYFFIFCGCTL
ncbi:Transmembrane protein [Fagus crenata]